MIFHTAEILNTSTGEARTFRCDGFDEIGTPFCWQEGNFSCDCNRKQFWLEAAGEYPHDLDDDADADLCPCGDGGFVVARIVTSDGRVIEIDGVQT